MTAAVLDTQALLWWVDGGAKLSGAAVAQIATPGIELFFSYASVWEIAIKYGNGKLALPDRPEPFLLGQLTANHVRLLPISIGSIFLAGNLPHHHKDPFDRLIAAQCLRHDLTLVSVDAAFDAYGVRRVW